MAKAEENQQKAKQSDEIYRELQQKALAKQREDASEQAEKKVDVSFSSV